MTFPRIAQLAAVAVLSCSPLALADWPQWRGPNRDGHAASTEVAPAKLPANAKVLWKVPLGFGLDSPVVAGGKVFILNEEKGREVLRAFAVADGKPLWSADVDESFKDNQAGGRAGPRCTAAVDGSLIFAQSCRGTLKCFSTDDGKEKWATNYTKDFGAVFIGEKGKAEGHTRHGNAGSPLVDGEHLIAGVGGKDAGYVCFEKATGKVVWKAAIADIPAYSPPVVATLAGRKQVIAFTTTGVIGIDRVAGKELWRIPMKTNLGRHVMTPIAVNDMVVVGSFTAGMIGVKVSAAGDTIKAEQAWATKDALPNFSSPVLVGGRVIGAGGGLKVFSLDPATGKVEWTQDANLGKDHAGLIAIGDTVLALGDNGDLVGFTTAGGYKDIGRTTVSGKAWCIPAYTGGKAFLRDATEMKCIELK